VTELAALVAIAGAASTFLLLVAIGRPLLVRQRVARRAHRFLEDEPAAETSLADAGLRLSISVADRLRGLSDAHRPLLPLILLAALAALATVAFNWRPGLLIALALLALAVWLGQRQQVRRDLLEEQLAPALRMVAAALESGYSVRQALERTVADSPSPIAEELAQVEREVRLGASLEAALNNLTARVGGDNFEFFATIVTVQHRVGGDLPTLLTSLANNIQERLQLRAEVRALTAQARYSGWVLTALPFLVLVLLVLASPAYINPLFDTTAGRALLLFAALLLAAGLATIRFISRVDV
jgi:Flp pilus assembly protein TadB